MGFRIDDIGAELPSSADLEDLRVRTEAERDMLLDWLRSLQKPRSTRPGADEASRFAELVFDTRPLVGAIHAYLDLLAPERAPVPTDQGHAGNLRSTLASLWGLLDDRHGPDVEPEIREHLRTLEDAMAGDEPDASERVLRSARLAPFVTV